MDDFAIPGDTKEQLAERTVRFLERAAEYNLCFKRSKCVFDATEIPLLGVRVGGGKIQMEEEKVAAVRNWPQPKNVKGIERFIGFANYYRRFIKDFSKIAAPLNKLKGKHEWEWGEEQETAFEILKRRITEEPVLHLPQDNGQFRVEVDACGYAVGGVLSQEQEGKWHPIAFLSHAMSPAEKNYEIYDKELLAIITALQDWRHYLLDAKERFEIWTDHENLKYFREPHKLNGRQARWYLKLQDYDFTLRHVPGKTNVKADILSRLLQLDGDEEKDKAVQVLKEEWFIRRIREEEVTGDIVVLRAEQFQLEGEKDIMEEIRANDRRETDIANRLKGNSEDTWETEGVVYVKGRIYVPPSPTLRGKVLAANHDPPDIGHPGQHRMIELVKRTYWWPSMRNDIKKYIKGCDTCQRSKVQHGKKAAPLHPLPVPSAPWEEISIDLIGPLPKSGENDAILVIVDRFSKMIRLKATRTDLTSSQLAEIYRDEIWKLHGIPRRIISDRGPQFASEFMKNLLKGIGSERALSTAYHPQTDGQTERINQEVEGFLRMFCNYQQDDWSKWLPTAEFQYNDKVHSGTGATPFFLNYGRHPWKGDITVDSATPATSEFLTKLQQAREEAGAALRNYQEGMKEQFNKRRSSAKEYKEGDLVWLEGTNIMGNQVTRKLSPRRYGPFAIKEKIGQGAYRLKLPDGWIIHDVFNEALLTPHEKPSFKIQDKPTPPPPEIINEEEEYEVEEIRGHRRRGRGTQYLVHWKGYNNEEDTWIAESQLPHAQEAINDYHKRFPEENRIKRGAKNPRKTSKSSN